VEGGRLRIDHEGRSRKFVGEVEHRTFSGEYALKRGQPALYVTERCVFRLTSQGLELIEVAPGIDIERDIVAHMAFRPLIDGVRTMLPAIFGPATIGLRERLLDTALEERCHFDAERGILFLNFRHLRVSTEADVEAIRRVVQRHCEPLGRKVAGVVNYDGFQLDAAAATAYAAMLQQLERLYYTRVTRYAGGAFERLKLARTIHREIGPAVLGAGVAEAGAADLERDGEA
jgi:propionate CoA-transferase